MSRGCNCGAQPPCRYDTVVIFVREDVFYPIVGTACEDWARHAQLNSGTIEIQSPDGKRIWPKGVVQ